MTTRTITPYSLTQTEDIQWETVYAEQLPRVYNFFRYRTGDSMLAQDLTSLTFEKAWKNRNRYRRQIAMFSTWLFSIARNVAADYYRRRHETIALETIRHTLDDDRLEEAMQRQADFARLSALLCNLSERERELVALKYGADLTNRDIAHISGLSESNVGTILSRVVQKLRAQWEAET